MLCSGESFDSVAFMAICSHISWYDCVLIVAVLCIIGYLLGVFMTVEEAHAKSIKKLKTERDKVRTGECSFVCLTECRTKSYNN